MAEPQSTIQKAEAARERGELWRAKEILQSRLKSKVFDAEIHRALGLVLLEMKDSMDAGRHLYVSGAACSDPDAERAIALFLSRYGGGTAERLLNGFPARARRTPLDSLPESVREDLERRGFAPAAAGASGAWIPNGEGGVFDLPLDLLGLVSQLLIFGVGFWWLFQAVGWLFQVVGGWFE